MPSITIEFRSAVVRLLLENSRSCSGISNSEEDDLVAAAFLDDLQDIVDENVACWIRRKGASPSRSEKLAVEEGMWQRGKRLTLALKRRSHGSRGGARKTKRCVRNGSVDLESTTLYPFYTFAFLI
ncbi:hypothetical protein PR202_ga31563 [Eleusine coracana subsp. coracana]|uniref:Uncharacterized protein n=1 Tax=Eleusine coracana subsp. coracana TaxID=191504 RepID=A0AAV5DRT6_ELECO|nr:hypothetical protein PR202_ga31563 [Eleusine coracana subsp. coracana]